MTLFFFFNNADCNRTESMSIGIKTPESHKEIESVWVWFIINNLKVQYGGGMGFIAAGLGWGDGKNKRWRSSFERFT